MMAIRTGGHCCPHSNDAGRRASRPRTLRALEPSRRPLDSGCEMVELVCFQETDRADSGRLRLETYFEDFLEVGMMLVNSGLVNEVCYCGMLF